MTYSLKKQNEWFQTGATRPIDVRMASLKKLAHLIETREADMLKALRADLGKPAMEAFAAETGFVLRDIRYAIRHLPRWVKTKKVRTPLALWPARAGVVPEPLGTVLILGPFNYPFQLLFSPMTAALAAGNCVCLKPSEQTPHTAEVIEQLCTEAFHKDHVAVVQGDAAEAARLTSLPFDRIFFTGSTRVGRRVAAAAAENLTPITLELGGKSPCVVCRDAPLKATAQRIMWGKLINAGQTCVAPDYVMVENAIYDEFLVALKKALDIMVPLEPFLAGSADYAWLINEPSRRRAAEMLAQTTVYAGGETDHNQRTMRPAILTDVPPDSTLMREEIFAPLLPVITVESFAEACGMIAANPRPLAAYLFTRRPQTIEQFAAQVSCGSICINDTISQIMPANLPFGGVGQSGCGRYRGEAGFKEFSNLKSVMQRSFFFESTQRYPPYTVSVDIFRRIYRWIMG